MRVLAVVVLLLFCAAPAQAATGTYLRLGHLSADQAEVDITFGTVKLAGVRNGTLLDYRLVEPGEYNIEYRRAGAAASEPVLRSALVTAAPGSAHTVVDLGGAMKVLEDDVSLPPAGAARVRVINGVGIELDVVRDGVSVHKAVQGNSATGYAGVKAGTDPLQILQRGKDTVALDATIESGGVYTVLITEQIISLRTDAKGAEVVPGGATETGFGGMAGGWDWLTALIIAAIVGIAMHSVRGRMFRFG